MGTTGITRLTPVPKTNLVYAAKTTTTQSITDGDIVKFTTGKVSAVATVTDGTTTNLLGVSESRSPAASTLGVEVRLADEATDYEVGLNTATTMTIGLPLMLVTAQSKQLAKSTTVTDKRVGFAIKNESAATRVTMRFYNPTWLK